MSPSVVVVVFQSIIIPYNQVVLFCWLHWAIIATLATAEVSAGAVAEVDQNVKSSRIDQN